MNKLMKGLLGLSLFLSVTIPTAMADHTTGHNISDSVDEQTGTWVPLIITLVFLGLGLGVLFAAVNKMKGSK